MNQVSICNHLRTGYKKMSKRYYPDHHGDFKRAKLDISRSDHNFPLSQNSDKNQVENWGDDNDDEILLLASQACEQAYSGDLSLLPDYTMCMQPGSTSTQLHPVPSTSKTEFTFKMPSANPPTAISTHLKEKCNRISSPLPGITPKVTQKNSHAELSDEDFLFTDKIYKGQDSDHIYRQLLKLQEDNAKLKSENGKLLEKCVTKEGEASILRTQLKSCQVSVDNARLEKIKAQEKVQMEWTEKLSAANNQMRDLRTQLDFKNLEIISVKEKCKKLESTKVRLTHVTVGNNDISSSHRQSSSFQNECMSQSRRVKVAASAVQTEDKARFMILNKSITKERPPLASLLPLLVASRDHSHSHSHSHSLLDHNEKLSRHSAPQQCRVYTTFHRIPSTPRIQEKKCRVHLSSVYEDLTCIATGTGDRDKYFNVFEAANTAMAEVNSRLEMISQRMTTTFQKEMDEKYMEATSAYLDVRKEDLLMGRALFKEEQEIMCRRLLATVSHVVDSAPGVDMFSSYERSQDNNHARGQFLHSISKICSALDNTSCAPLYSGLLLSITHTIKKVVHLNNKLVVEIVKSLITSRAMPCVVTEVLSVVRQVARDGVNAFCPRTSAGNLKIDYDQGVLLYKKDSCYLQVLFKQVETCLKCIERQHLVQKAADTTRDLIVLYANSYGDTSLAEDKPRCDCQLVLIQVIVYALRICAVMLDTSKHKGHADPECEDLLPVCRSGIALVFQCSARDGELMSRLAPNAGHLQQACETLRKRTHPDIYVSMVSELAGAMVAGAEELPPSFQPRPWINSFEHFSLSD